MRELKADPEIPILETHYPIKRIQGSKRWILASTGSQFVQKRMHNECVEAAYHRIRDFATRQLQPGTVYYDRDLKNDKTHGIFGMHSFVSPTFYWRLDCDLCYDYQITYALHNCPFEAELQKLMRAYPLDRAAKVRHLEPDFATFYQNVVTLQDKRFLFTI
jgi:hypothetical protein